MKTTCLIPVPCETRLPELQKFVIAKYYPKHPIMEGQTYGYVKRISENNNTSNNAINRNCDENGFSNVSKVTEWYEPQSGYFFTEEEMEKIRALLDIMPKDTFDNRVYFAMNELRAVRKLLNDK